MGNYRIEIIIETDKPIKRTPIPNEVKFFLEKLLYIHPDKVKKIKIEKFDNIIDENNSLLEIRK